MKRLANSVAFDRANAFLVTLFKLDLSDHREAFLRNAGLLMESNRKVGAVAVGGSESASFSTLKAAIAAKIPAKQAHLLVGAWGMAVAQNASDNCAN